MLGIGLTGKINSFDKPPFLDRFFVQTVCLDDRRRAGYHENIRLMVEVVNFQMRFELMDIRISDWSGNEFRLKMFVHDGPFSWDVGWLTGREMKL